MRLKNKIRIKGDTLQIFEAVTPERRRELEQIAKEIYNNSGNSDANERDEMMKGMGIMDDEERNEVAVMINNLADLEMNEANMSIENYKVGDILKFKDGEEWKVVKAGMRASDSRVKPDEITIAPHNQLAKDRNISLPIDINLDYLKTNLNEAYPTTKEPVTVTMESNAVNELSTYNNKPVTSKYNGKTITWDDYEVVEKNVDGGGYTDAIILMGSDEDGNEYTCEGSTTHGDVDEWDDSTIEMVKSINEAKKAKTDPKDKKKADKTNYGNKDIADVDMVNPYELRKGIRIEMVDTDDYEKAMDKAVKKLKKDPMFYSNLIANVKETKGKRSDVPTEVKDKKLNKVSDKLKDKANEMSVSKKDAAKKNANDSLNKKEKASGKPKGVKEMTMKPKASKGMKSMSVPGKEKKTNLKESFNLWDAFKKNILR